MKFFKWTTLFAFVSCLAQAGQWGSSQPTSHEGRQSGRNSGSYQINSQSTWAQIESSQLQIVAPKIALEKGTQYVSVMNLCVKGESLVTVHPVVRCAERDLRHSSQCLKWEERHFSTPLKHWAVQCAGRGTSCIREVATHALNYRIPVAQKIYGRQGTASVPEILFVKSYQIPQCGDAQGEMEENMDQQIQEKPELPESKD